MVTSIWKAVLLAADGAEGDADLPDRVRPRPNDLQDVLGAGIGGEVEIVTETAEQRVPDRPADQGQREPGLLESAGEVVGDGGHPQQFADRAALHLTQGTGAVFVGVRHNRTGYVPGRPGRHRFGAGHPVARAHRSCGAVPGTHAAAGLVTIRGRTIDDDH